MNRHHHSPVWALLRRNISPWQIAGFAVANLVGLTIILAALQFYFDALPATRPSAEGEVENLLSRDFLVISKRVHGLAMAADGFTPAEIADLEAQPWVRRVGRFSSSQFRVMASLDMQGRGLSTYLFFESIPDEYFDVSPDGWTFDPSDPFASPVPIIISKDYLALYNFGFAPTQGMPQLSEKLITTVPVTLSLSGSGGHATMAAYVCGFSQRLNTIAVPQSFMDWANSTFSPGETSAPSRLIVETNSPGNPAITDYLAQRDWELAGDKELTARAGRYLAIMTSGVTAVGVVITLLALFILLLSLHLLLQKSRTKLRDLMLLGYSPRQTGRYYRRLVAAVNASVALSALLAVVLLRSLWLPALAETGVSAGFPWQCIPVCLAITLIITAINFGAISRTLNATFKGQS